MNLKKHMREIIAVSLTITIEIGAFLGDEKYFITPDILKISKNELLNLNRSTEWKLINMEYFLRNFSKYIP